MREMEKRIGELKDKLRVLKHEGTLALESGYKNFDPVSWNYEVYKTLNAKKKLEKEFEEKLNKSLVQVVNGLASINWSEENNLKEEVKEI